MPWLCILTGFRILTPVENWPSPFSFSTLFPDWKPPYSLVFHECCASDSQIKSGFRCLLLVCKLICIVKCFGVCQYQIFYLSQTNFLLSHLFVCFFISKCVEWTYAEFTPVCRADYFYLKMNMYRSLPQVKIMGTFSLHPRKCKLCLNNNQQHVQWCWELNSVRQPINIVVWPHLCRFKLFLNRGVLRQFKKL